MITPIIVQHADYYSADIPPSQLEWHMKLWWPHNEAMIALLMAYEATMESRISDLFVKVYKYSKAHVSDLFHPTFPKERGKISM